MADPCQPGLPMGLNRPEHDPRAAEFSPAQLAELDRQRVALKAASPLQAQAEQHDVSDLALFRASDEKELPL